MFIPADYADLIKLTLDSNGMFYRKEFGGATYTLMDMYALNGFPIIHDIGSWSKSTGLTLSASKYRWNRRRDFEGAEISNALSFYKNNAEPVYNNQGQ